MASGHLHMKSLKILRDECMVFRLPRIDQLVYVNHAFMTSKLGSLFPIKKDKRASNCIELIHTDLCGSMQTKSLGGSIYFLLFIDDYSRMR